MNISMKFPLTRGLLGVGLFLCSLVELRSQFYAPETEYHDPVQRVFVVEAARVLAWWSDPAGTNLAEVTFKLAQKADQSSVWDISWVDSRGKTVKAATVSYSTNLLKSGPEFYRSIFKQLWQPEWKKPELIGGPAATEAFWRGAERMGLSRETSLRAAFKLVTDRGNKSDWIPEIAGLLTHAALPGYGEGLTLDKMVLARGAAWLAFADSLTQQPVDSTWAPVLFQAGRERAASQLWQATNDFKLNKATPQQQGWNMWLRKPFSREVFVFATRPRNLPMAMPMLRYDVRVNETGSNLAELIEELAGSPERLSELHNYAPLFATKTGIGGGHILNGAWAVYNRFAWMQLLEAYSAAQYEYHGYTNALSQAKKAMEKQLKKESDGDASMIGFRECAPLLNLARTEGIGKLVPTASVTARDLLNYGWEMTGRQMGARYFFVNQRWGVRDLAETIYNPVTTQVEGLMPFFKRQSEANLLHYDESLKRLQMVEGLFQTVGFSTPAVGDAKPGEQARLFVKRCWLRPREVEWQARALWDEKHVSDVPNLIASLHAEGGSLADAFITHYLSSLNREAIGEIPGGEGLLFSIAESLPQPTYMKMRIVFDRKAKDLDDFKKGQEMEKLYWQNPDSGLEPRVIIYYIEAGAYKSARRFYSEARSNFLDPVSFSNGLGLQLFVLGYCLNDPKLRAEAMENSASASYMDMMMHLWEGAIEDKPKEMEKWANEIVQRYEQEQGVNSQARRLLKFLPLLPALRDARHASHREALEYFGKDQGWSILRFIWIEKFKLSNADAVVFLGGKENSLLNQFLMAYLEKDLPLQAVQQLAHSNFRGEQKILGWCLYHKLHHVSGLNEDTDLKPPGTTSIREAVMAQVKKN